MRSYLRLCAALALLAAVSAQAAGINLRWDSCAGPSSHTFACNTNAGSSRLFGSFVVATPYPGLVRQDLVIDLQSASAELPAWWQLRGTGACRPTAASWYFESDADPSGTCFDYWGGGQTAGGIGSFLTLGPGRQRIVAAFGLAAYDERETWPGTEYLAFRLSIDHGATTGTGACGGCSTPMCIVFNSLQLGYMVPSFGQTLSDPIVSNVVTWQSGAPDCQAVPARARTWGAVKALYR